MGIAQKVWRCRMNIIKRLFVFLVVGLFLVSIVPLVFAEEGATVSADASVDVGADTSGSASVTSDGTARVNAGSDDNKNRERTRKEIRVRIENRKERVEARAGVMENKSADIRARQNARLEVELASCKDRSDAARCEERVRSHLDRVTKLGEKDVERIEKIRAHKLGMLDKLETHLKGKWYMQFRHGFKARALDHARLDMARSRFEAAQKNFTEAKQEFQTEKSAFAELRSELKNCEGKQTPACDKLRANVKLKAEGMITKTLDMILEHLHKVRATVEQSEYLSADQSAASLKAIDTKIAAAEALKVKASGLTEESSKADIQAVARQVAKLWKTDVKPEVEHRAGFVMASRMGGLIVQSERLSAQLDHVLEAAVEKGVDTTSLQSKVDQFNVLLSDAQKLHADASASFESASTLTATARSDKVTEAQQKMHAAQEKLKEAHKLLKDITKTLHEQKLEGELDDDDVEDDDDEDDDVDDDSDVEDDDDGVQAAGSSANVTANVTAEAEEDED